MATSRGRVEDTYETQNDQRLDELHSKVRTLRGVSLLPTLLATPANLRLAPHIQITSDIYDDAEGQNSMLDDTVRATTTSRAHWCADAAALFVIGR